MSRLFLLHELDLGLHYGLEYKLLNLHGLQQPPRARARACVRVCVCVGACLTRVEVAFASDTWMVFKSAGMGPNRQTGFGTVGVEVR